MGIFISPQGEYPRFVGDIELENSNWNQETDPVPSGWIVVEETPSPVIDENQMMEETFPIKDDAGNYHRNWKVTTLTDAEVADRKLKNAQFKARQAGLTDDEIKLIAASL
jgi:hypothetical protein